MVIAREVQQVAAVLSAPAWRSPWEAWALTLSRAIFAPHEGKMLAMQRIVQRLQSGPTVFRNATSLRTHLRLMPRVRRACATLRRAIVSEIRYSIVVSAHLARAGLRRGGRPARPPPRPPPPRVAPAGSAAAGTRSRGAPAAPAAGGGAAPAATPATRKRARREPPPATAVAIGARATTRSRGGGAQARFFAAVLARVGSADVAAHVLQYAVPAGPAHGQPGARAALPRGRRHAARGARAARRSS